MYGLQETDKVFQTFGWLLHLDQMTDIEQVDEESLLSDLGILKPINMVIRIEFPKCMKDAYPVGISLPECIVETGRLLCTPFTCLGFGTEQGQLVDNGRFRTHQLLCMVQQSESLLPVVGLS